MEKKSQSTKISQRIRKLEAEIRAEIMIRGYTTQEAGNTDYISTPKHFVPEEIHIPVPGDVVKTSKRREYKKK